MKKNNQKRTIIRSFRYTEEVEKILMDFKGESLNDKFINLVLHCSNALKEINQSIKQREKYLAEQEAAALKRVEKLREEEKALRNRIFEYQSLIEQKSKISKEITAISLTIIDYREKVEKLISAV